MKKPTAERAQIKGKVNSSILEKIHFSDIKKQTLKRDAKTMKRVSK